MCRAWTVKILLFSVLCFALIPAVIYTLSYWPYAQANGDTSLRGLIDVMLDNQKYMFTYHKGVTDSHPYSSRWYQWILNIRPILYYLDTSVPGMKTAFGAFSNPVVCWAGLLAVVSAAVQMVRRRCGRALFIVIGYLSQLVPWMFIGRITFEYHYFPSILFLTIALAYVFNDLAELRPPRWKGAVYGVTGGARGPVRPVLSRAGGSHGAHVVLRRIPEVDAQLALLKTSRGTVPPRPVTPPPRRKFCKTKARFSHCI